MTIVFPVEAAHVLMFRRSIGEAVEGTDVAPGDLVPLTFTQAVRHFDPEYALRPRPGREWFGSGGSTGHRPAQNQPPSLHAEQHFTYHSPLRIGDVLYATSHPGRTWEKAGSSGTLRFAELITEFRDASGGLRQTSIRVTVQREAGR
jgi:hypothetical protein